MPAMPAQQAPLASEAMQRVSIEGSANAGHFQGGEQHHPKMHRFERAPQKRLRFPAAQQQSWTICQMQA